MPGVEESTTGGRGRGIGINSSHHHVNYTAPIYQSNVNGNSSNASMGCKRTPAVFLRFPLNSTTWNVHLTIHRWCVASVIVWLGNTANWPDLYLNLLGDVVEYKGSYSGAMHCIVILQSVQAVYKVDIGRQLRLLPRIGQLLQLCVTSTNIERPYADFWPAPVNYVWAPDVPPPSLEGAGRLRI